MYKAFFMYKPLSYIQPPNEPKRMVIILRINEFNVIKESSSCLLVPVQRLSSFNSFPKPAITRNFATFSIKKLYYYNSIYI